MEGLGAGLKAHAKPLMCSDTDANSRACTSFGLGRRARTGLALDLINHALALCICLGCRAIDYGDIGADTIFTYTSGSGLCLGCSRVGTRSAGDQQKERQGDSATAHIEDHRNSFQILEANTLQQ